MAVSPVVAVDRPAAGRSRGFQGAAAPWEESDVQPYQRTDSVEVTWR